MNAVMTAVAVDEMLTMSQRQILRAAVRGGRLERSKAGGVTAVDSKGLHIAPRYPLRTINALTRNGYLVATPKGWEPTSDGRRAGEG